MNNGFLKCLHKDSVQLYGLAGILSLFISWWFIDHQWVINPDAICYLMSAETISKAGIHGGMQICSQANWPFYPWLISIVARVGHWSLLSVAYSLNSLFTCLSVLFFIAIVQTLGASRRVRWLAVLVILTAQQWNHVRVEIIRDHGFWACYLAGLWILLVFFHKPSWGKGLWFGLCFSLATLFRIEGAIFWLFLPGLSFFIAAPLRKKCFAFVALSQVTIMVVLLLILWLFNHPDDLSHLGRIPELWSQMQHGVQAVADRFQQTKASLIANVLPNDAKSDADLVLILVLLAWYSLNIISNLSILFTLLMIYAVIRKPAFLPNDRRVLMGVIVINVAVTLAFFAEHLFLSQRYLIALSLVFMVWVPFGLDALLQRTKNSYRYGYQAILLFMMIVGLVSFLPWGHSKRYLSDAGAWLAKQVPINATLYANDYQLMYYSQHFGAEIFARFNQYQHLETIAHTGWKQYDYIALRLNKDNEAEISGIIQEMHLVPVQHFKGTGGNRVEIYQIGHRA